MPTHDGYNYDVFISYSHADGEWVRDWLVPRLRAESITVCIDRESFDVGVPALINMENAVANSRHTLLVLTPRWVASKWTAFESLLIQHTDPTNLMQRLLPVVRERCEPPPRITMLSYADLGPTADADIEWRKLLDALRGVRRLPDSPAPKRLVNLVQPRDTLHQLPAPVADFVGRADAIIDLVQRLSRASDGAAAAISGIRGLGGIGKTQLAYKVAALLAPTFPDAQLVLDLRGASDSPLSPVQALQTIIRFFEPLAQLPDDQAQLESLYRSLLSGKRVLVLADDARDAAQVRPLLPPSGSALLVTSRQRFNLDGMYVRDLETLSQTEAEALLLEICPRIGVDAARLAQVCGRLPLALRLSASMLANDATLSVSRYLERLSDQRERLKHLFDPDDPARSVEASLELSYAALPADAQHVLCQLSVFPAPFDLAAAVAVVRLSEQDKPTPDSLESLLSLLYRRSLLDYDTKTERYSLHDLVRVFAAARLTDADDVALRHAQHYTLVAYVSQNLYLQGGDNVLTGLTIFDNERQQIDAGWQWVRAHASADNPSIDTLLIDFADATALVGDLRYDKRRERIPQLEAALAVAQRLEQRSEEGRFLGNLGLAFADLGEVKQAIELYQQNFVIARAIGDHQGEGAALGNLGNAYRNLGEVKRAIEFYEQQLVIVRTLGDRRAEGNALNNLGIAYANLGEVKRAIELYEQALLVIRTVGDHRVEGNALGNLGNAYRDLGEVKRAIEFYEQQLVIVRTLGDRRAEGGIVANLGVAYANLGEVKQAIELYEQALLVIRMLGDRRAEGAIVGNLGNAYRNLGEMKQAIGFYEQALELMHAIGDRFGEANTCWNLGLVAEQQGDLGRAIELMQVFVDYEQELGHPDAEKRAARVEQLRQRLVQAQAPKSQKKRKRKK